jgi:hypothetical protein
MGKENKKEVCLVGTLEQTKVDQAINRLESVRRLLNEVNLKDANYKERFTVMNEELKKFGQELEKISEKMKIENLGKKSFDKDNK